MKNLLSNLLYLATLMLAVGVFLPLTRFAVVGDVSYFDITQFEAYLVIALAISAPILFMLKLSRLLLIPVAGVWITLFLPWVKELINSGDGTLVGQLSNKAASLKNEFAADLFLNITDYAWGGYVFLAGLILFTVSGLLLSANKR